MKKVTKDRISIYYRQLERDYIKRKHSSLIYRDLSLTRSVLHPQQDEYQNF